MRNYANFYITNDSNITLVNMPSALFKILGRIKCSESEWTLCTHILMIMSYQFRSRNWLNKPDNLSNGCIAAVKLAKHMLKSGDVCLIDRSHIFCLDEHGHTYASGNDSSDTCQPREKDR